jgi:hypothetical protein
MKILYHTPTASLKTYPRSDNEPVVGLSADYEIFEIVQESVPEDYNPATHSLSATQNIDTQAKTVTRGFEVVPLPPVTVTKRSLLLKMTAAQRQAIAAGIASMPEGQDKSNALIYYNNSTTVSRAHPMVSVFASILGLDAAGMDALFAAAQAQDILEKSYL